MRRFLSLFTMLMLSGVLAFAQNRVVTGIINDDKGAPVPYATITETGTKNAVVADANGAYTIKLKNPSSRLTVSGSGFTATTLTPSAGNNTVVLQNSANLLTEVTVSTALGIRRQAKSLGYSSSIVSGKDIELAKPISIANGLTGKVSGLQINTVNNGLLAPTRITLRGNRSLTGNNQPLLVVDGAIFYNDLNTLNPDDIADVTVLKGASAAAIYGSDASNGALIITTKRGVRGKPTLTFTSTVQLEKVSYLPKEQTRFGNNGGERYVNDPNDLSTYIPYENQSFGPEYNGKIVPLGRPLSDGSLQMIPYMYLKNEKRNFFNTGVTTQNNINYQAGDENQKFYMSLQDLNTTSTMPGDKGRRDIARVGGSRIYGKFNANYNVSYTYLTKNVTNTGEVYNSLLDIANNVPITHYKDWKNDKFSDINGFYNDYDVNPYWTIGNVRNKTTDNNVTANVQFGFQATKWLGLSYRVALTNLESNGVSTRGEQIFSPYAKTDKRIIYTNYDATKLDTVLEAAKPYSTDLQATTSQNKFSNQLITSDFNINIDKNVTSDINLKSTLGTSYQGNRISNVGFSVPGLFFPVFNVSQRTGNDQPFQSSFEARKFGAFGDLTVGFRNYAFLHGSYRGDIDSRLSKKNRFIPYYDVDASLVLTDIFKGLKNNILNFAKIRAAYSVTGNASALAGGSQYIAFGAYATSPSFNAVSGFPFTPSGATTSIAGYSANTTAANPDIQPETVKERELGLELSFLKGRINLTAAVYNTKLNNGIVYAQVSRVSGLTRSLLNAANTENKGFEVEAKVIPVKTRNITWNVGANYSHNNNKVISIQGDLTELQIGGANGNAYAIVGKPYPSIKSRDWLRDSATGKVIVNAITGNPSQDPNLKYLGDANAKDILGLTTSLTWKGFTVSASGDYRGGHKIFNSIGQQTDFTGIGVTSAIAGRQRFVFPNSVTIVNGKAVDNTNITTNDGNFDFWPGLYRRQGSNYIISAAAWKLRELAIGYDLPSKLIPYVSKATITLSARNLLMIRPKTNVWTDPEFSEDVSNAVGRTSANQIPPSRIYGATLSVTF